MSRAPMVRSVDALAGQNHPGGTSAFFRALGEADDIVHAAEQRDELQTRLDELTALVDQIKVLHHTARGHLCLECGSAWPCATIKLIEDA
jgi:hypothetical protein